MRKPTQAAKVAELAPPEPVVPWGILPVGTVVRAPMTPYRFQDLIVVNDPGPQSDESRKVRTKSSVKDRDFAPIYMRRDRLCRVGDNGNLMRDDNGSNNVAEITSVSDALDHAQSAPETVERVAPEPAETPSIKDVLDRKATDARDEQQHRDRMVPLEALHAEKQRRKELIKRVEDLEAERAAFLPREPEFPLVTTFGPTLRGR